jgi:EpsI family protein
MIARMVVACAAMLLGAAYLRSATEAAHIPTPPPLWSFPLAIGEWAGRDEQPLAPDVLKVLGVDDYLNRSYRTRDGRVASLYVGYFARQTVGDNIHSPMKCLPGAGWEPVGASRRRVTIDQSSAPAALTGREIEVNRVLIAKGLERMLVLYWYQSGHRVVANDYWAKTYKFIDAVRFNRTDGALVRIIAPIDDDTALAEEAAEAHAARFLQAVFPLLDLQFADDRSAEGRGRGLATRKEPS